MLVLRVDSKDVTVEELTALKDHIKFMSGCRIGIVVIPLEADLMLLRAEEALKIIDEEFVDNFGTHVIAPAFTKQD